jgi:hypothetical protein
MFFREKQFLLKICNRGIRLSGSVGNWGIVKLVSPKTQ